MLEEQKIEPKFYVKEENGVVTKVLSELELKESLDYEDTGYCAEETCIEKGEHYIEVFLNGLTINFLLCQKHYHVYNGFFQAETKKNKERESKEEEDIKEQ